MNGESSPKIRENDEQNPIACDRKFVGYSSAVITAIKVKLHPEPQLPIRKNIKTPIEFWKSEKLQILVSSSFNIYEFTYWFWYER